jgi:hypothetical protein
MSALSKYIIRVSIVSIVDVLLLLGAADPRSL